MADAPSAMQSPERTPFNLRARFWVMMFLQYFVQGSYLPVISVYLQDALGFSSNELGVFGSALAVGPLVAPFIVGQVIDRYIASERVLAFCHLIGGLLMLALYRIENLWAGLTETLGLEIDVFWPIVVLGTIYSMLYVPSMFLTNSLTFQHLQDREGEFPAIRLWGTIGFIVPAWLVEMYFLQGLGGEELNHARGIILALSGSSGILMGLYSLTLPHTPPYRDPSAEVAPWKAVGLVRMRHLLVLVLVSLLVAVAHKFFFVWNSPFLKDILRSGGFESALEQRIASIGQIFEVVVMAFLGFLVRRLGFKWTMVIGTSAYLVRCLILAWAITLDGAWPVPFASWSLPVALIPASLGQALHGFCFGCFLAAAYMYVDRASPQDIRGSVQNLYGAFVVGLGMFLGGFASGWIGNTFTTEAGQPTMRDRLGIAAQTGVMQFEKEGTELVRDWPGIWLGGAVIAALALFGLILFFPKQEPQKEDSSDSH